MSILHDASVIVARALYLYINEVEKLLRTKVHITGGSDGLRIRLEEPSEQTIDERIAKIDAARTNLVDGLKAIDELKATAEENKLELNRALERLDELQAERQSAESELEDIRQIASADVTSFRRVIGIPSKSEIRRQQFVGFISGVVASLVTVGILWFGSIVLAIL